jgi:hypothetical protein
MKNKTVILIVCLLCVNANGVDEHQIVVKVQEKNFKMSPKLKGTIEGRIEGHLAILKRIGNCVEKYNKRHSEILRNDTIAIRGDSKGFRYEKLNEFGIEDIVLDSNNCPRSIYFEAVAGRIPTMEELDYNRRTGKVAPSYANLTETVAVQRAKEILYAIYGEKEFQKFDSISISQNEKKFDIWFLVKIHNEIWDSRSSNITIDANSGEIELFRGDGINPNLDYTYTPKISKNAVLKMYQNEIDVLNADVNLSMAVLTKYQKRDKSLIWAWHLYGARHDKKLGTAAMMFIDSETGEVLFKKMDY